MINCPIRYILVCAGEFCNQVVDACSLLFLSKAQEMAHFNTWLYLCFLLLSLCVGALCCYRSGKRHTRRAIYRTVLQWSHLQVHNSFVHSSSNGSLRPAIHSTPCQHMVDMRLACHIAADQPRTDGLPGLVGFALTIIMQNAVLHGRKKSRLKWRKLGHRSKVENVQFNHNDIRTWL